MRVEDVVEELKKQYPDTVEGLMTKEELIERQTQVKMVKHIELMIKPKKGGK